MARETGYSDLASASYALDTTGSITLIATIAQGAATTQRVGKKIMLKSIQMRGFAFSNTATTVAEGSYLIVYDKRPTGALPAITDILVSINSTAFNNDTNSGRFQIIRRQDFCFAGNSTAPATGKEIFPADDYIKIRKPIVYKAAATGAIGDIEQGALYLVTCGASAAGTGAATLTVGFRTRFIDV